MSNNTTSKTILDLARSQLGVKEDPAGSNAVIYNTVYYGREVSGRDYPWCAVFLWWLFHVYGASSLYYGGKKTASSTTLMNFYKKQGQFVTAGYRPGDLAIFSWSGNKARADHAGIIESADDNSYSIFNCIIPRSLIWRDCGACRRHSRARRPCSRPEAAGGRRRQWGRAYRLP